MTRAYLFLAFSLLGLSCGFQKNEEYIKPRLSDITESVYASVTIRPENSYFPQPSRSGIIEEVFVAEGDQVKKGQLLFRISMTADINNRLSNAELNLQEAKANFSGNNNLLLNIEAELESTQQQLLLDSTNWERQEGLWQKNIGKKVDLDRSRRTYQATLSQYNILQNRYAQTLTNLENNYQKALNLVRTEKEQLRDFNVRAKMDGKVYSINKEIGEQISPQEQFAEIGSADDFLIEMDIDEIDITKIEIGDTVTVALEAYPDEVFLAILSKIAPKKDEMTQTFRVESYFLQKPPKLYHGLSGEANIISDVRKQALIIPAEYLMTGNQILTAEGERSVKVGVRNMDYVEIRSGVDTATVVIKPVQQ